MLEYASYVATVIKRGDYILADMEETINKLWIEGKLSNEDREELIQLAADNAKDVLQVDILAKIAALETRVYNLEFPTDIYPIWKAGQVSERGVVYRFDVTGDGEYDLCRYDGGRTSTSLSIGKIEGWHMLDRELNIVADITKDADGNFVIEYITPDEEPEPEPTSEPEGDSEDLTDGE